MNRNDPRRRPLGTRQKEELVSSSMQSNLEGGEGVSEVLPLLLVFSSSTHTHKSKKCLFLPLTCPSLQASPFPHKKRYKPYRGSISSTTSSINIISLASTRLLELTFQFQYSLLHATVVLLSYQPQPYQPYQSYQPQSDQSYQLQPQREKAEGRGGLGWALLCLRYWALSHIKTPFLQHLASNTWPATPSLPPTSTYIQTHIASYHAHCTYDCIGCRNVQLEGDEN